MIVLILGLAMAFNIIIIFMKLNRERYMDGLTDFGILVLFAFVLGGSAQSLAVGTIASCVISLYLFSEDPKFLREAKDKLKESFEDEDESVHYEIKL